MKRFLSLLGTGVLAALIWRAEVEWHGWEGLIWTGYHHFGLLVAVVLLGAWVLVVQPALPIKRRVLFSVSYFLMMTFFYVSAYFALSVTYSRFTDGTALFTLFITLLFYVLAGIFPIVYFALVKMTWPSSRIRDFAFGYGAYLAAFPLAMLMLWITDHRGGPDWIHAIKSGFVIPFLFIAFGLPQVLDSQD